MVPLVGPVAQWESSRLSSGHEWVRFPSGPVPTPFVSPSLRHPNRMELYENQRATVGCAVIGEVDHLVAHLGVTAKMTGRDLSGQPIQPVTPEVATEAVAMGWEVECEQCGKRASRIHLSGATT